MTVSDRYVGLGVSNTMEFVGHAVCECCRLWNEQDIKFSFMAMNLA
jgi:hypothetical protein